jgi:hypothetical protein
MPSRDKGLEKKGGSPALWVIGFPAATVTRHKVESSVSARFEILCRMIYLHALLPCKVAFTEEQIQALPQTHALLRPQFTRDL